MKARTVNHQTGLAFFDWACHSSQNALGFANRPVPTKNRLDSNDNRPKSSRLSDKTPLKLKITVR